MAKRFISIRSLTRWVVRLTVICAIFGAFLLGIPVESGCGIGIVKCYGIPIAGKCLGELKTEGYIDCAKNDPNQWEGRPCRYVEGTCFN